MWYIHLYTLTKLDYDAIVRRHGGQWLTSCKYLESFTNTKLQSRSIKQLSGVRKSMCASHTAPLCGNLAIMVKSATGRKIAKLLRLHDIPTATGGADCPVLPSSKMWEN